MPPSASHASAMQPHQQVGTAGVPAAWPPLSMAACTSLQQRLQRELPHFCGFSSMLHRAMAIFQPGSLRTASERLLQALQQYKEAVRAGRQRPPALRMVPQELACACQLLPRPEHSWLEHLRIEVPFHTESPEGAAITAALTVLLDSLHRHAPLRVLEIRLGNRERLYQQVLQQRGLAAVMSSQLQAFWGRVLAALARLAAVRDGS